MSELEAVMAWHIKAAKLPEPEREYRFHAKRKWRADFAWPAQKVILECEGGIWSGGRHTTATGFILDAEKYNTATAEGWRVFRVAECHIKSGQAIQWVAAALQSPSKGFEVIAP